jgi:predicted branched-subunit amino acid permease
MYLRGFKAMLPILTGVIPFGLVMGTVASNAQLDLVQTVGMNFFVFAGASQLAAIDLMTQSTTSLVVVVTGLIINLRFMLYSAAFSHFVKDSSVPIKALCAYSLTDQSYAATVANESKFKDLTEALQFYIGASIPMILTWHISVILGFIFGNFAPASLSLDFAVPLSFIALVLPTMKNKNYVVVAAFASVASILLKPMPYNLGLLTSALLSLGLGAILSRKKSHD